MPVRSLVAAETRLKQHFESWAYAVLDAINAAHEQFAPAKHALETWTQRGIIRDLIVARLIPYHERTPGLHWWREINSTWFGAAHGDFVLKPKKLGDDLRACINSNSQIAIDFNRNVPPAQSDLFDNDRATTLYLGYIPTENRPLNPPVYLVCPSECGYRVEWSRELLPPKRGGGARLYADPSAPSPDGGGGRVRVRANPKKRAKE